MTSSLTKSFVRLSPIATILALSFACGSESEGPIGGSGGQGDTGGAAAGGDPSASGGAAPGGGSGNADSGGSSAGGQAPGSGGDGTDTGGAASGGDGNGSGGSSGSGNDSGADCSPNEGEVPPLKLTQVAGNLDGPVFTTHPPGDDRLFVITLTGSVRVIKDGALLPTPFLDISSKVAVGGAGGDERGLLGIAFHPDYAENGLFYLHYSDANDPNNSGDSIIEEYKVSSDPDVADPGSGRLILKVEQPDNGIFRNHKGGAIGFGADKMLYIGLGDGGGSNDPEGNGQKLTTLLGKILRINPLADGDKAYTIPEGNLKDKVSEALPEIWDYGLRNPFRFTFDPCTGDLYIGDVGQNKYEEIDIELAGDGGHNYGWNRTEGFHCFSPMTGCDETGITPPYIELERSDGSSITGGAVYRGSSIPSLRGAYFYADYVSNRAWYAFFDREAKEISSSVSVTQELSATSIVAITTGNDGELYFTSLGPISGNSIGPGAIYKLEADE